MRADAPIEALPPHLRDAVRFIMANLAEPLSLDSVAAAAGVSKRTLSLSFQMNLGQAVMAFVRQRRLELANQKLLAADVKATTVTNIAMNSGFQHLGRFSSVYRQCFGEYPSESLRRQ
ncbi:MAG: AraC family transcriptional regulator [Kiloniellales bacterium]|nr:AraC family transcriptional regulator [Kiloniellales bacterium]